MLGGRWHGLDICCEENRLFNRSAGFKGSGLLVGWKLYVKETKYKWMNTETLSQATKSNRRDAGKNKNYSLALQHTISFFSDVLSNFFFKKFPFFCPIILSVLFECPIFCPIFFVRLFCPFYLNVRYFVRSIWMCDFFCSIFLVWFFSDLFKCPIFLVRSILISDFFVWCFVRSSLMSDFSVQCFLSNFLSVLFECRIFSPIFLSNFLSDLF